MMVAVDEPRQHHLVAAANNRHVRMLAAEFLVGADLDDCAVFLQYRTIHHLVPAVAVDGMGHHRATADQRCRNVEPPCACRGRGRLSLEDEETPKPRPDIDRTTPLSLEGDRSAIFTKFYIRKAQELG